MREWFAARNTAALNPKNNSQDAQLSPYQMHWYVFISAKFLNAEEMVNSNRRNVWVKARITLLELGIIGNSGQHSAGLHIIAEP